MVVNQVIADNSFFKATEKDFKEVDTALKGQLNHRVKP